MKHLGGGPAKVIELKEGWFSAAILIDMSGGREFVLKIALSDSATLLRYEKQMMD